MSVSYPSRRGTTPTYVVEGVTSAAPATGLANFQMWLVSSAGATGIFAGHENKIATFTHQGGWGFSTATQAETAYDKTNALYWIIDNGEWAIDFEFDTLGTSTAIPTSHFANSVDYNAPGVTYAMQSGAPVGIYRFTTAAAATGVYTIQVNNSCVILDATVYQHSVATGAGCTIDIVTNTADLFPTFTCDQASIAILRPVASDTGIKTLTAGDLIKVTATDVAGALPKTTVIITFALGY
tara:strand:- start:130 stop:846 length:717 start_codon:yes stop_codon:yes gene_type:complete